jgi:hypothetical protein
VAAAAALAVALLDPGAAHTSTTAGPADAAELTGAASRAALGDPAAAGLGRYQAYQRQVQTAKGALAQAQQARAFRAVLAARAAASGQATPSASASAAPEPSGSPQQIAMAMLGSYGWPSSQFSCLNALWERESGWSVYAANPSGAYGIPQALPGSKMAAAGPDWESDAATQIRWGLGYIKSLYGSPCGAWAHEESTGWY